MMINGDFHILYANHGAGIKKPTKLGDLYGKCW